MLAILDSPLHLTYFNISSRRIFSMIPMHRSEAHWSAVPWVFLSPFLENGSDVFLFQSLATLPDSHDFSNVIESDLVTTSANSLGMHLIRTHRFMDAQVPLVVVNLIFTYSRKDIAPLVPTFWLFEDCVKSFCQWRLRQKVVAYPQPYPCPLLPACLYRSLQGVHFLGISFSGSSTCKSHSCPSLHPLLSPVPAGLWPSWPQPDIVLQCLYSSQDTYPCFHYLCISFLLSSLTKRW